MNPKISAIVRDLEELFTLLNERFYDNQLNTPVVTVSPDCVGGALGWCTSWKAWRNDEQSEEGYYEICLTAENLKRPYADICETMLHEMVHLYQRYEGIKGTSRHGTYHNKLYKADAEERGLIVDKSPKYGWSDTSLNAEAKQFIDGLNRANYTIFRVSFEGLEEKKARKGSSSRKYVCPGCGCIIRATKEVWVICGDCNDEFELEE
ncbi:MAG: hypothetical protein RSB98_04675 [Raoultibacter sp.]